MKKEYGIRGASVKRTKTLTAGIGVKLIWAATGIPAA
jgi:hypothetical protein